MTHLRASTARVCDPSGFGALALAVLLASADASAQDLSKTFHSAGFRWGFEIIPAVLALLLAIALWRKPALRHRVWKVLLAWGAGMLACVALITADRPSALALMAFVGIGLGPWIAVAMLAIALRVKAKH
jgi:hypothetical protein